MAQLSVQYPSLEGLPGVFQGYATGQRMTTANQNEGLNQAQALQDIYHNEQMNPIRVRQAGLNADTTAAQLPGIEAESGMKQRNYQVRQGIPIEKEQQAALSELAAKMSDSDWTQTKNDIYQHMQHPDPTVAAHARQMYALLPDIEKERLKQQEETNRLVTGIRATGEETRKTRQMEIEAGRYKKGLSLSLQDQLTSGKLSYEKAAVMLQNAAYMAELEGDADRAKEYRALANEYAAKNEAAKAAGNAVPKAGSPDIGKLGNIPTNPNRPTTPFQSPTGAAAPTQDVEKVLVISPDGRKGYIPKSQLQDALKAGYKQQ